MKKIEVDFLQRDIDTPVGNALATLKRHKSFDPLTRNEKIAIGKFAAFQTRRGPETVLAWHRVCANDTPEVAYPALRKMLEKSAIDFLDQCDDVWFHSLVGAKFSAFLGSDKPVVDIYDYLGFPGAFCPIGPHFCLFFKPKHSTFPRSEYELRNELLRHDFLRTINLAMCQLQPDYIFAENEAWDVLVSREYLGESIRRPRPAPFGSSGT